MATTTQNPEFNLNARIQLLRVCPDVVFTTPEPVVETSIHEEDAPTHSVVLVPSLPPRPSFPCGLPKVDVMSAFLSFFPAYVPVKVQREVDVLVHQYDAPCVDEAREGLEVVGTSSVAAGEKSKPVRKPRVDNSRWWVNYSLLAHAEFNSPKYTRAQEMIVSAWIRKTMSSDGVTSLQIAQVLAAATRMAFVPNAADILAAQIGSVQSVKARERLVATKWWSSWWDSYTGRYDSSE